MKKILFLMSLIIASNTFAQTDGYCGKVESVSQSFPASSGEYRFGIQTESNGLYYTYVGNAVYLDLLKKAWENQITVSVINDENKRAERIYNCTK